MLDETWAKHVAWAIQLAARAHERQVDKQGQPYALHPLRVGMLGRSGPEMVIGFLHDVVEDCEPEWTEQIADYFRCHQLFDLLWPALTALSHVQKHEPYVDYINRVAQNWIAVVVKDRDIRDNWSRIDSLPKEDAARLTAKYRSAMAILDPILDGKGDLAYR